MNLFTDISPRANETQGTFHVVVEIAKWTSNKIEYQPQGWYFILDRALYQPIYYPFDYWFVPQTWGSDQDALDVMLLVTHPTFAWCVITARTIGCIDVVDAKGHDVKILAVPTHEIDPRWDGVRSYEDLSIHFQQELLLFFKEYRKLETAKYDKIHVGGFVNAQTALAYIQEAHKNYQIERK